MPPPHQAPHVSTQRPCEPSYSDVVAGRTSGVAGYTSVTDSTPPDAAEPTQSTCPRRNCRLPARLNDYVHH